MDVVSIHRESDSRQSGHAAERQAHSTCHQERPLPLTLPSELTVRSERSQPRPPRSRHCPHHAFRQPVDREQEQRPVEDEAVVEEPGQELGQDGQRHAARHGPRDAPETSEEQREEEQNRGLEGEAVRRDVAVQKREERARSAREGGGNGEGGDPHVVGGEPQRFRGHLAALDGETGTPPCGAAQIGGEPEGERRRQHHRPVVHAQPGLGDVEDAARSSRHRAPLDEHALHDETEGDGDHGQIRSGDAERGGGHRGPHHGRDHNGDGDGDPFARSRPGDAEGGGVGAEGVEPGMAERGLSGEAYEDVEPGRDDGEKSHRDDDVEVIGVGGEEGDDAGRDGEGGPAEPGGHTRLEGFSPSNPHGLTTRTRITRPNPTISRARVET